MPPSSPSDSSTRTNCFLVFGRGAKSGKRHTGSSNPIAAMAAFTGWIRFDELTSISGRYLRCSRRASAKLFCRHKRTSSRHLRRNLVRSDGNQSLAAAARWSAAPANHRRKAPANFSGKLAENLQRSGDVARSFFDADDVVDFRQPFQRRRIDVCAGAPGTLYRTIRQRDRSGDGLVVLIKTFRRGLVVIRRDRKDAIHVQRSSSFASATISAVL